MTEIPILQHSRMFFMIILLACFSCKDSGSVDQQKSRVDKVPESEVAVNSGSQTADMIRKVNEAVAQIDPFKVPYVLNRERANLLKQKIAIASGREKIQLQIDYGIELIRTGDTKESIETLKDVLATITKLYSAGNEGSIYTIKKWIAIAHMRLAEQENCIANHNNESCIIPISLKAQHQLKDGAQESIRILNELLAQNPADFECQYLLNIGHMVLGQYPSGIPEQFRLPEEYFSNNSNVPKFEDIGDELGIAVNEMAGGTCVDDFNNDGYLDIIASSWGFKDQIRYFEHNSGGGFTDKTDAAGLSGVTGGLNIKHADFNNDGYLDFIILRGAWLGDYGKIPNSLMRNNGDGTFTDVTQESGIYSLNPTQTAVWADFNLDGWIDLFIANESSGATQNNCELFMNNRGKFTDVVVEAGIGKMGFFKGVACGDINNDGLLDLYLSDYLNENTLYLNRSNNGKIIFEDISDKANVRKPLKSFSTWMFDYDNDGFDDIFVSGYSEPNKSPSGLFIANVKAGYKENRPQLYHNNGDNTFTDQSLQMGLNEPVTTMGCNIGDLNNDGFLDFYLSTGDPSLFSIVPNRVYLNQGGSQFKDITYDAGFGHIQKGHSVGFGDIDLDGDQDIYVVMGGAFEGDIYRNILYENPIGNQNNWTNIRLEGTTSNRSAIGARIVLEFKENNKTRKVYHRVGIDASFGGNSLAAELGLGSAKMIDKLEITWPNKEGSKSLFQNVSINKIIRIKEGQDQIEVLNLKSSPFAKSSSTHQHH